MLELTVHHVQQLHKEKNDLQANVRKDCTECRGAQSVQSPTGSADFAAGFKECIRVVHKLLSRQMESETKQGFLQRITNHLEQHVANVIQFASSDEQSASSFNSDYLNCFGEKDIIVSPSVSSPGTPALLPTSLFESYLSGVSYDDAESHHSSFGSPNQFGSNSSCLSTPSKKGVSLTDTNMTASPLSALTSSWTCDFKLLRLNTSHDSVATTNSNGHITGDIICNDNVTSYCLTQDKNNTSTSRLPPPQFIERWGKHLSPSNCCIFMDNMTSFSCISPSKSAVQKLVDHATNKNELTASLVNLKNLSDVWRPW